jgi:hypothetical protein
LGDGAAVAGFRKIIGDARFGYFEGVNGEAIPVPIIIAAAGCGVSSGDADYAFKQCFDCRVFVCQCCAAFIATFKADCTHFGGFVQKELADDQRFGGGSKSGFNIGGRVVLCL